MGTRVRNNLDRPKLNVLVAEDDAFQRIAIADLLNLCDFQVTDCENGLQARDELLKTDNEFEVILLDLIMPELNGLELLRLIKTIPRLKDVPVFMMSSDGENEVVATCLAEGAKDYIVKPVGYQHLKNLKEKVLSFQQPKKHTENEKAYYSHVRNLGRGAAGSVELVRRSTDNELFAMKVIPMHFMNETEKKNAENEVHLLKVLVGPTIIRYYESFVENDSINIIMEYAEGGSLYDKIQDQKKIGKAFDKDQIVYWLAQMVISVLFMHQRNILHRDIKTQNMFLKKNIIKLGDFGISKSLGTHNDFAKTFLGTPYFMPPEVCKGELYGSKADIWALGCALYELVTFKRPFQHDMMSMVFDLIINKPYAPLEPDCDKDLVSLIDRTLQKDPAKRPSIWELSKIPAIEEKIKFFYKEHPQESDQFQAEPGKQQVGGEESKSQNQKPKQEEENFEELAIKFRKENKFTRSVTGLITQKSVFSFQIQDLFQWIKKDQTWKSDDQIQDSMKMMIEQKIIQTPYETPNQTPDQMLKNGRYCLSRDLVETPANMTTIYKGLTVDILEQLHIILNEGKNIQQQIRKALTLDQEFVQSIIKEYVNFESLTQVLQSATNTDHDLNKKLAIFLNVYELMVFHKNLRELFDSAFKIQEANSEQGLLSKTLSTILPFLIYQSKQEFQYKLFQHNFTIEDIKHGILRGNKAAKNFRPWSKQDPRIQMSLQLDQKVLFLFDEEANSPTKSIHDRLKVKIEVFNTTTIQSRLEEIVKQWVATNVCLDVVESELIIHPQLQIYQSDFGESNEHLIKWLAKYMTQSFDVESIIKEVKESRFFITFQDPNQS